MTDDLPGLDTALRDRVADEHPDLDRLISVSTHTGTRLRRRRVALASVGATVAGIAVIGIVGSLSGSGGTPSVEPGVSSEPTLAPTATPTASPSTREDELEATFGGDEPLRVDAPGWQCEEPADEKFGCTKGGATVTVAWRSAAQREDYLDPAKATTMPGIDTFVSRRHGPFFATVSPGLGATQADVDEVGRALLWTF